MRANKAIKTVFGAGGRATQEAVAEKEALIRTSRSLSMRGATTAPAGSKTARDGGNADFAGAKVGGPPAMSGLQKTQEQFSVHRQGLYRCSCKTGIPAIIPALPGVDISVTLQFRPVASKVTVTSQFQPDRCA